MEPNELWVTGPTYQIKEDDPSDWECQMFGMGTDMVWRPKKGNEPNWFWRWMQYLLVGHRWVKATN